MEKVIYSAITWVDEEKEMGKKYAMWLENAHLPELSSQPGFTSVRRVKLEEVDKNQWQGYQIIMEIENREFNTSKSLLKVIDILGREKTFDTKNTLLFYIYSDGSVDKVFKY